MSTIELPALYVDSVALVAIPTWPITPLPEYVSRKMRSPGRIGWRVQFTAAPKRAWAPE